MPKVIQLRDYTGEETFEEVVESFEEAPRVGVVLSDCPCGCGRIDIAPFGKMLKKDVLWYSEILKKYATDDE